MIPAPRPSMRGASRRIFFTLAAVFVFFTLTETTLRLLDRKWGVAKKLAVTIPPYSVREAPYPPLTQKKEEPAPSILIRKIRNDGLGEADGSGMVSLSPEGLGGVEKRIFVLGGSLALGAGVRGEQTFAVRLQRRFPGFRVLLAAENAMDSEMVLWKLKTIVDHYSPGGLVVMSGNNEWLLWRWEPGAFAFDGARNFLSHFTIFSYLTHGLRALRISRVRRDETGPSFDPRLGCAKARVVPGRLLKDWDRSRKNGLAFFRHNLRQMAIYTRERGVPLILCKLPYRLDLCPAYFLPQPKAAIEKYRDALRYENAGDEKRAAIAYEKARELMAGNLGAMASINRIIGEVGDRMELPVVAIQAPFSRRERRPLGVNKFFLDFCHVNDDGHRFIAEQVIPVLARSLAGG